MRLTALVAALQAARLRRPVMHWRVLHVPIWMHALVPNPTYRSARRVVILHSDPYRELKG